MPIYLAEGLVITAMQLEGDCVYYIYDVSHEIIQQVMENMGYRHVCRETADSAEFVITNS